MFAIKVENLSKIYKKQVENSAAGLFSFKNKSEDFYALKELNFEIPKGETVGIIGGNGAGKSTLLKILSNISYPSSGRALIDGRVTSLLEVGTGFHPELSGRENVYLNGSLLGMTKKEIQTKFDEIVDFSGIEGFIDSPVKNYSSGMYVRLAFSVAAHLQTEIILLDEVLAVGDAEFQKKCNAKMESVNLEQSKTILLVSHDLNSINKLTKRSILLEKGILTCQDDTNKVIAKYLSKNVSKNAVVELNNHVDKKNKFGIQKLEIYVDNQLSNQVYTGCNLKFKVYFSKQTDFIDPEFGLVIKNANDLSFIGLNNRHIGVEIKPNNRQGIVVIELKKFKLYSAENLYINLYYGDVDVEYESLYNAATLDSSLVDFYNSGQKLDPKYNIVIDQDININLAND